MVNILKKWVESDKREIKRLNKIANKVESYADQMAKLSDEELKAQDTLSTFTSNGKCFWKQII